MQLLNDMPVLLRNQLCTLFRMALRHQSALWDCEKRIEELLAIDLDDLGTTIQFMVGAEDLTDDQIITAIEEELPSDYCFTQPDLVVTKST